MAIDAAAYIAAEMKAGNLSLGHIVKLVAFYQKANGLTVDGFPGPVTRHHLEGGELPKYDAEFWREHLRGPCAEHGINLDYAVRWVLTESGGNPCAIGAPGARGPDGHPQEMGIAQFYNPDDLVRLKLTGAGLRAYCVGAQTVSRTLTDSEVKEQAEATVALIVECQRQALADLHKVGAAWNTKDVARLTKLQHGLPGISRSGLPATTKYIGRAPADWAEFTHAIMTFGVKLDPGTERYRAEFGRILENAVVTSSDVK